MKWETGTITRVLSAVPYIKLLATNPAGSEMTTEQLVYEVIGATDRVYVRGFTTDSTSPLNKPDNVDVEMVEVTTEYSDGGDSPEAENMVARTLIKVALKKTGYDVVDSLDPYF